MSGIAGGLGKFVRRRPARQFGHPQQVSPVQRAQIVELACLEPIAKGLHITHWSSEDLARRAVEDKIIPAISPATVRRILHDVDLQPHRTRYWKTARLDARFKERAEQVLWCYANAARLAEQGIWWCVSMRSRPSRSWSVTRSAERSPGRSSNRSSIIPGMGRSTCWCSWSCIAG